MQPSIVKAASPHGKNEVAAVAEQIIMWFLMRAKADSCYLTCSSKSWSLAAKVARASSLALGARHWCRPGSYQGLGVLF